VRSRGDRMPPPQTKERPLPSWVPDLRIPLLPKPFDYFGCTHHRAATHVKPAVFELTKGQPGDRFRWTLTISAAEIDTITQVGESYEELNMFNGMQVPYEDHMLDLVARLGYEYHPAPLPAQSGTLDQPGSVRRAEEPFRGRSVVATG
jgi:hypothetical protein